jgi:integrating conjugative element protein (TIGR03756 family)
MQRDFAEEQMSWVSSSLNFEIAGAQETPEQVSMQHDDGGQLASLKNFREVDVIGYPWPFHWQGGDNLYCPSQATAYMPHYSSAFDAFNWRMGFTEILYIFKIFTDPVGISFIHEWGSVYPRIGSLMQKEDAKASAVTAQRAADIATRGTEPRIYSPMSGDPGQGFKYFQTPGPAEINSTDHKWQMFSPKEDNSCYRFDPIAENFERSEQWLENRVKLDGAGVYALWRGRYECCKDKGQYLFSIRVRVCI